MFRYADPTACPRCRTRLGTAAGSCAHCHAVLDDARAYDVFLALQQVDRLVTRLADRPVADRASVPAGVPSAGPAGSASGSVATVGLPPTAPVAPAPARPALSGLSVPRILLGLGALCLVVAALVFLVVAWASLGVGGRTAVLVGFTVTAAGLAAWSARAGLRAGAESLTSVAFGLLVLDLAGARTSGWLGDLDARGFSLLTGGVLVVLGAAATTAARRTKEPRLLSAEVATSLGVIALVAGVAEPDDFTHATWVLAACVLSLTLAGAAWRLRLAVATWTAASMAVLTWLGLAGLGLGRLLAHPTWTELFGALQAWPLLAAAALAAAPAAVRVLPAPLRVGGAAVAVLFATLPPVVPALDEGVVAVTVTLAAVTVTYAAVGWLLPSRWSPVAVAPLVLAGGGMTLMATVAALHAVGSLLDHGLWAGTATGSTPPSGLEPVWTVLLPVAVAALGAAVLTLARMARIPLRPVLTLAGAALLTALALAPALYGVPFWLAVGVLASATAAGVAWALRTSDRSGWIGAAPSALLGLGAALVDDGLTIAVLALLTAACAAGETRRAPADVRAASGWALPPAAAATTWAIGAAAGLSGEWRATPVLVVLALISVARGRIAHEVAGLGAALVAIAVGAGLGPLDLRTVAAQLAVTALVATWLGVRRRPEASLAGLALLAAAALAAWPDTPTACLVLATGTAAVVLHEVRRVDPAALLARSLLPAALGALLWAVGDLVGLAAVWRAVPVLVALGALTAWKPDLRRELPATVVALWTAGIALTPLADAQSWAAVYLTLAGVTLTTSSLLHPSRRPVAWGGLACLTAAMWLRLEELGVGTVEAYTLPLALVLLVVGTVALLRGDRSSLRTQGAGLGLALVPSLLQVLAEPMGLRAVLLGLGTIALIAIGVNRRWAAPLLAGSGTLAVLVLRQVVVAQQLPQWALIGLAGIVLTVVGLTWERRLAEIRAAAGYVRGLR